MGPGVQTLKSSINDILESKPLAKKDFQQVGKPSLDQKDKHDIDDKVNVKPIKINKHGPNRMFKSTNRSEQILKLSMIKDKEFINKI